MNKTAHSSCSTPAQTSKVDCVQDEHAPLLGGVGQDGPAGLGWVEVYARWNLVKRRSADSHLAPNDRDPQPSLLCWASEGSGPIATRRKSPGGMVSKKTIRAGRNLKDHPDRSDHFFLSVSTALFADSMLYFNLLSCIYPKNPILFTVHCQSMASSLR